MNVTNEQMILRYAELHFKEVRESGSLTDDEKVEMETILSILNKESKEVMRLARAILVRMPD